MIGEGRCTFGTRAPIEGHLMNEIIRREVKHFRNYTTYTPNFGSVPITSKFYARHEALPKHPAHGDTLKIRDYTRSVTLARNLGPRHKHPQPVTENMRYGWYQEEVFPLDRSDPRLYHPRVESPHTKADLLIMIQNPRRRRI